MVTSIPSGERYVLGSAILAFNLKQIGIGNEQCDRLCRARGVWVKQIRAKYPNIKICGTSGPSADGKDFDYGWQQMRKLKSTSSMSITISRRSGSLR